MPLPPRSARLSAGVPPLRGAASGRSVAQACRPPLTTVRQPVEEMAAEMARLLLTLIDHPGHAPTSVIFEPELVIRESA